MFGHHLLHPTRYTYLVNELAEAYHDTPTVSIEFDPLERYESTHLLDTYLPGMIITCPDLSAVGSVMELADIND